MIIITIGCGLATIQRVAVAIGVARLACGDDAFLILTFGSLDVEKRSTVLIDKAFAVGKDFGFAAIVRIPVDIFIAINTDIAVRPVVIFKNDTGFPASNFIFILAGGCIFFAAIFRIAIGIQETGRTIIACAFMKSFQIETVRAARGQSL